MLEMLVLDTDHFVELDRGSAQGATLQRKLYLDALKTDLKQYHARLYEEPIARYA